MNLTYRYLATCIVLERRLLQRLPERAFAFFLAVCLRIDSVESTSPVLARSPLNGPHQAGSPRP